MVPKVLFFLVPAALLVASVLIYALWEKLSATPPAARSEGAEAMEGAFRSFYHALWVLILWSGLCLSLPLWVSYKERILGASIGGRWPLMARVLALPTVFLLLLWYGGRQGYLKWIDGLSWPDGAKNVETVDTANAEQKLQERG